MASIRPEIEFWFEFGSTYSYPAALRIETLARDRGATVAWRPFLLGPIFSAQGWNDSPFNLQSAKGRYMWRDLERICAGQGIAFRRPSRFPRNGLLAARIACRFAAEVWLPRFVCEIYRANFALDREIERSEEVARVLEAIGEPASERIEAATTPESKSLLREQTERAVELGIFGAPSFVVDGELYWGNDRLDDALAGVTQR